MRVWIITVGVCASREPVTVKLDESCEFESTCYPHNHAHIDNHAHGNNDVYANAHADDHATHDLDAAPANPAILLG